MTHAESHAFVPCLLVVDDDTVQRRIITKLGVQAGFAVTDVASFEAAQMALRTQRFDCITLDLSLGPHSGALLVRTIVETDHHHVPLVIVSGADEHVVETTSAIARSHNIKTETMTKPLKLTELRSVLVNRRENAVAVRGNTLLRAGLGAPHGAGAL